MIGVVATCAALAAFVALVFVASVRLGMLLGFRLDREIEARASIEGDGDGDGDGDAQTCRGARAGGTEADRRRRE